jgi:ParB/RepB/Spo0J family partition protein
MGVVLTELALDTLYISPYNVRSDPGDLTELIDSIRDRGVLEPILVWQKGEQYEVIAGSRRVAAARQAGLSTIPASLLELTDDVQAILTSVIENIQRKDLTLEERVKTYQVLQKLDPDYRSHRSLAKVIGLSHRKIGEDFQAYEIALKLQPHGIRVESDFPRSSPERQSGEVLPEYHAVLLHQAISYLVETGAVPEEDADDQLVKLARLIAELSQDAAKATLEEVKAGGELAAHQVHSKAGQHSASPRRNTAATQRHHGVEVACGYCEKVLMLVHRSNGTHQVKRYSMHLLNQKELPGFNT